MEKRKRLNGVRRKPSENTKETVFHMDSRVFPTVKDVFRGRLPIIRTFSAFKFNKSVFVNNIALYTDILYHLMKMIARDTRKGSIVYMAKNKKSSFYVGFRNISAGALERGHEEVDEEAIAKGDVREKLDIKITGYKKPLLMFNIGYAEARPCVVILPRKDYAELVKVVNKGQKFLTPSVVDSSKPSYKKQIH